MPKRYSFVSVRRVVALAFVVSLSQTAVAQLDVFLELDNIPGNATSPGYEDQIEILSYSHGVSNLILIGGGQSSPKPSHSAIGIAKLLDPSTTPMLKKLSDGLPIATARFDFVSGAGKSNAMPMLVMRVDLEDVYVTSYTTSWGAGSTIVESWSLLYSVITITYYNPEGGTSMWTYDVTQDPELAASVEEVDYLVDGEDVVFTWRTLSESGNYGFEIQHLEDDEYRRAAYVPAAGWSSEPLEYEVRIRGLRPGFHSFRLASLGVDGRIAYSQELRVALGVPEGTTLALEAPFPNPFTSSTGFFVTSDREREATISVFDMLGREVQVLFDGTLDSGAKTRYSFEAPEVLTPGMYFIRVRSDDATETRSVILGR